MPGRRLAALGLALGTAVLAALIAWQGVGTVAGVLGRGGPQVFLLPAYFALPLTLAALSWMLLLHRGERGGARAALGTVWIGLAVNWLLPVAQIGGEVIRGRLLTAAGRPFALITASLVIDKTLQVATQVLFAIVGLVLLMLAYDSPAVLLSSLAGVGLLAAGGFAFYRLQRRGLAGSSARLAGRLLRGIGGSAQRVAAEVDAALETLYRRRGRLLGAFGARLAFRFALAGEMYLAFQLLDHPVGLPEAIILESLVQATRAAAFAIPGGVGAQEGALVAIGIALGVPAELALGVALCKRLRELVVGLPALMALAVLPLPGLASVRPRADRARGTR